MSAEKQRLLVCGDVGGAEGARALLSRVSTLTKKSQPFDLLLIAGDLDRSAFDRLDVPLPVYALGEGGDVAPNVTLLGRRGVYATTAGVRIAYLSKGCGDEDCAELRNACYRGQSEYRGVDVLITAAWPENVGNGDPTQIDLGKVEYSARVAWLAMHLRPRYHFVASENVYYERPPYRNLNKQNNTRELATRFIGLAPIGNAQKQKWLYACSLQPLNKMRMMDLLQGTTDETECPYNPEFLYQHKPGKNSDGDQYFYNMNSGGEPGQKRRRNHDGPRERKRIEFDLDKCWFCLSSPTVEKHLVICVGDHCYLALAKGPLTPTHCLITPITHHQSYTQAPTEVKEEIQRFKMALVNFYDAMGSIVVFFERNYKTSHLQINCVPVPQKLSSGLIDEIESIASGDRIEFKRLSIDHDICDIVAPGLPYFHMTLPDGDQLFTKVGSNFPLHFGRDILANSSILDCEEKSDWHACELPKEQELEYVAKFRKKFEPFDFTQD